MSLDPKRALPSLDGLRALSVIAVILGHSRNAALDRIPGNGAFRNADQGVTMFFVLSGFLITHLLLKELNREGAINLKAFYFRRTLRIFPPFYVFLALLLVLRAFQIVVFSKTQFFAAATYTWNYVFIPPGWDLGHCWSLSLEEQFYMLWPACMKYFSKKTNFQIAAAVVLLSPLSRVATYYLLPSTRYHMEMMLHTHLDGIMLGCLMSLAIDMKVGEKYINAMKSWMAPAAALGFLLVLDNYAFAHWKGTYRMTIGLSLTNVAVAALILFGVFRHTSVLGRVLNVAPLRHLGAISYSLYLWQQVFTGPHQHPLAFTFVATLLCAEASYFLVEKPSFRLRDAIMRRWIRRRELVLAARQTALLGEA